MFEKPRKRTLVKLSPPTYFFGKILLFPAYGCFTKPKSLQHLVLELSDLTSGSQGGTSIIRLGQQDKHLYLIGQTFFSSVNLVAKCVSGQTRTQSQGSLLRQNTKLVRCSYFCACYLLAVPRFFSRVRPSAHFSLSPACWHDREEAEKRMLCSWSWQVSRNRFGSLRLRCLQFLYNRFLSKRAVLWCPPPSSLHSTQQRAWDEMFVLETRSALTGELISSLIWCKNFYRNIRVFSSMQTDYKKCNIQATEPIFFYFC